MGRRLTNADQWRGLRDRESIGVEEGQLELGPATPEGRCIWEMKPGLPAKRLGKAVRGNGKRSEIWVELPVFCF